MSQENVEIVRRAYASPALLADAPHVASDAEFDFSDLYPDQPVLRGVEEMRVFRDRTLGRVDSLRAGPVLGN